MDKYKINKNREPLTAADVQKGQDFDAFLKTYSAAKTPFYKTGTFYMSVVALGIVIGVGGYFLLGKPQKKETPFVQAALPGIDIADTVYQVDAANGGEFMYNTGSLIRVPEGGFLDSTGKLVTGKVELHYREFHNTADIFLAGIPMTYDSAGQRFHFESAGMLEITAWQNGKQLNANPAAPLKVAMASTTDEDKFNIYYLDTLKKNWEYIAKDKAALVGFVKDSTSKRPSDSLSKYTANLIAPVEPKKADKNNKSFVIDYDPKEFPELNAYKGVRFEVDEAKTPYNTEDKKVKWEDVQILRDKDGAGYSVTFIKGDKSSTYMTYVVIDEKNYAAAKKSYDERYATYQAQVNAKAMAENRANKSSEAALMTADAKRIYVNDTSLAAALARRNARFPLSNDKEDMVVREFLVKNFGIWNSDCPASLPAGNPVFVKLLDSRTKKPLELNHVILVEKGRNAIYTYYSSDLAQFRFNADAENLLWAVTSDGKLAVCSSEELKSIAGKPEATLTMAVQAETLKTPEQARTVLGI